MSAWVVHRAYLQEGDDMPCSRSLILTCRVSDGGTWLDVWWCAPKDEKKDEKKDDQK